MYDIPKILVIFFVTLIYSIEVIENVFASEFQRNGRLDIGLSLFSIRWIVTLFVWSIVLIITRNLLTSIIIAFFSGLATFLFLIKQVLNIIKSDNIDKSKNLKKSIYLLKKCFPLCISDLLAMYLPHCARYSIDKYMNDSTQAIFSYIAMPIFLISVGVMVIFNPMLKGMADNWNKKETELFKKKIFIMCIFIMCISIFTMFIGFFLEEPVLSFLYAVDLKPYKKEMMLLLLAGVAFAYVSFFKTIMVIFRLQKVLMIFYLVVAFISLFIMKFFTQKYAMLGACTGNVLLLSMLAVFLFFTILIYMYDTSKKRF